MMKLQTKMLFLALPKKTNPNCQFAQSTLPFPSDYFDNFSVMIRRLQQATLLIPT